MRIVVGAVVERPLAHSGVLLRYRRMVSRPNTFVPKYSEGLPSGAFTSTAL